MAGDKLDFSQDNITAGGKLVTDINPSSLTNEANMMSIMYRDLINTINLKVVDNG